MKHIIFGNYGNNTLALIQWAKEQCLEDVCVVNVDTGWSSSEWLMQVEDAKQFVRDCGFESVTLKPKMSFSEMVIDRQSFPSVKFQWCTSFLKGLPFLEWLDSVDPSCAAVIIVGSRRSDSRTRINMQEYVRDSEYYGGRKVWFPLYLHDDCERNKLVETAGFKLLEHRSLECQPCVHATKQDWNRCDKAEKMRLQTLENKINRVMLDTNHLPEEEALEFFDRGCGSHYVCGE